MAGGAYARLLALAIGGFVASFATQLIISYHFGTSQALDAYLAAVALLGFFAFYAHPIREALVPGFHRRVVGDRSAGHAYFTQGFVLVVAAALVATAALLVMPARLAALVTRPDDAALHAEVASTVRLIAPALLLLALSELLNAVLSSYRRVVFQQAARLLGALSVLACVGLLSGRWGSMALVAGFIAGQAVMAFCQAALLLRAGLRLVFRRTLQLDAPFFGMAGALLVSYACGHAYVVFEKKVLMGFGDGWVSAMHYGTALVNVVVSVFAVTVANMLAPHFLDAASREDAAGARRAAAQAAAFLLLILGPVALFAFRHAQDVIELVFARGAFDASSLAHTTEAFRATIFGLLPVSLLHVLTRALLSQRAARVMASIGVATALSGAAVLAIAAYAQNAHWALQHWLAGNTIGMTLAAWLFVRRHPPDARAVRQALRWALRWALVMAAVYWLAPDVSTAAPGKLGLALNLLANFVVVAVAYAAACALTGLHRDSVPAALRLRAARSGGRA